MAFTLPDLPYSHDALAGLGMSAETLEYHHDLHHNAYVVNGNKLIAGTEWEGKSLEDIITGTYDSSAVAQNGIFNNASQHWNHMKFWEMMGPGETGMPSELEAALNDSFGSVDAFKDEFKAARRRFEGHQDREWREPALLRPDRASRLRCVGAFLLYRLPQQASRLPVELPRQAGQLGICRRPALGRADDIRTDLIAGAPPGSSPWRGFLCARRDHGALPDQMPHFHPIQAIKKQ